MSSFASGTSKQQLDVFISEVDELRGKAVEEAAKPRIVRSRYDRGYGPSIPPSPLTEPFESLKVRLLNFLHTLSFGQREQVIFAINSMFSPPDVSTLNELSGKLKALRSDYDAGRVQLVSEVGTTPNDAITLNLFISSKINELAEERQALYELIPTLLRGVVGLHAWVFERDTTATERPSRELWLETLEASVLYIGMLGEQYGEWTIDEFNRAKEIGLPKLIFVKDIQQKQREQRLTVFINGISDVNTGLTPQYFSTIQDLERQVTDAISNWIVERLSKKSRHSLLETLKKCKEDYLAWFDHNQNLQESQKNEAEHRKIIRKAIKACEDAEDALDNEGKTCSVKDALSPDWDSCYSSYKNNLSYIAKRRLVPYFVTGQSSSEGPADKAGAQKMGTYHQRNLDALEDAIVRLKELL